MDRYINSKNDLDRQKYPNKLTDIPDLRSESGGRITRTPAWVALVDIHCRRFMASDMQQRQLLSDSERR